MKGSSSEATHSSGQTYFTNYVLGETINLTLALLQDCFCFCSKLCFITENGCIWANLGY